MIANLVTLLTLLPKVFDLVTRLAAWVKEAQLQEWLNDLDKTITELEKAQTQADKRNAARGLVDVISRLK